MRALILICLVRCTPNFPAASVGLAPGSPVETGDPVVFEPKLPEEPSFTEHDCIQSALPSPSDTTVTLTGDNTIELTGIPLSGRKEIILNGHTFSLTSFYSVSADAVLGHQARRGLPKGNARPCWDDLRFKLLFGEDSARNIARRNTPRRRNKRAAVSGGHQRERMPGYIDGHSM